MAAHQNLAQICIKDRRIQAIAFETSTQIKRTTPSQDGTDKRHIQIQARGNVRQAQALLIDDVTQQQVVEVTTMTRHVNNFVVPGHLVQLINMLQFDSVVNSVPYPTQKSFDDTDCGIGNMCGNFLCISARFLRGLFEFDAAVPRLGIDRYLHVRIA